MYSLFFGDSITEGSNSEKRFTDFTKNSFCNFGESGTTIGEYSIYPVDGKSLISKLNEDACFYELKRADTIFLEYGINDVSAIMCGFVKEQQVLVSFIKALDFIHQVNPKAKIYFLTISNNYDIIKTYAQLQCNYLAYDYFKEFNFNFPASTWADYYKLIIANVEKKIPLIPMIRYMSFFDEDCLSDDNIHPNSKGHKIIAENIEKYL